MTKIFSFVETGAMSPYPTVIMVENAQYKLVMYISSTEKSATPEWCSHVSVSSASSFETRTNHHAIEWAIKLITNPTLNITIHADTA
jgi:hypothetical protein